MPGLYEAYIASPAWSAKRQLVLDRDCHQCQTCLSEERLEVHHKTYDRLGNEDLSDLITLCHDCHEAITCSIRQRRYELKEIKVIDIQRITPIINREAQYAKIEISTHIRSTPNLAQRADQRSFESLLKGVEKTKLKAREDGRRF